MIKQRRHRLGTQGPMHKDHHARFGRKHLSRQVHVMNMLLLAELSLGNESSDVIGLKQ